MERIDYGWMNRNWPHGFRWTWVRGCCRTNKRGLSLYYEYYVTKGQLSDRYLFMHLLLWKWELTWDISRYPNPPDKEGMV